MEYRKVTGVRSQGARKFEGNELQVWNAKKGGVIISPLFLLPDLIYYSSSLPNFYFAAHCKKFVGI